MSRADQRRGRRRRRSPSRRSRRAGRRRLTLALCALVMVASLAYIVHYEFTRREIERANEAFSALYDAPEISAAPSADISPSATRAPIPSAAPSPVAVSIQLAQGQMTAVPSATCTPEPADRATETAVPSPTATGVPSPTATTLPSPTVTLLATDLPSPTATTLPSPTVALSATDLPTSMPAPTLPVVADIPLLPTEAPEGDTTSSPSGGALADDTDLPRATADADTLVMALETPPPVQQSFRSLLEANPETVGFLTIDGVLSLPVVQRAYDNEYYLTHSFDLAESIGGTLFLDGANLLAPEDDCLIVYGHNMRNGTMFQPITRFEKPGFLRKHPLLRFDTIYENRTWVPFAALTLSADPESDRYLDIRQFTLDELGFDLFVTSLRALSNWQSPVEVEYGDKLLLLVTCEYTHNNGRFVLALRAQRPYESELQLRSQVQASR